MDFKVGRPTVLTEELIEHILKYVPGSYVLSQVARRSMISHQRLSEWLKKGKDDIFEGNATIYAQFAAKYDELRSEDIQGLISGMLAKGAWQAHHEILKSSAPEDFGKDSELYKELFADFQKIVQSMSK